MATRTNGTIVSDYLNTGKAGCLGTGIKKAIVSIDDIIAKEAATLKDALMKWGVEGDEVKLIPPLVLTGPSEEPSQYYKKDKKTRFFGYETYILGFTEKQVLVFTKKWNVVNDSVTYKTEEIFYKDVTSITANETTKDWGAGPITVNKLALKVSGEIFESGYLNGKTLTEEMIKGVKNLIREKKSA